MHKRKNVSADVQSTSSGSLSKKVKRAYSAPSVLSSEPLEAVASVCQEKGKGGGGPGKQQLGPFGSGCTVMGS